MEAIEDRVKSFLAADVGYGNGRGCGYGYGSGRGNGFGDRDGYRYRGDSGYGYGDGYGDGNDDGYGDGSGDGSGFGNSDGNGDGDGRGVKDISGDKVYVIDGTPTIIRGVRGNIARGFVISSDLQLAPCFIVKENGKFAHGDTLRDAFTSLQEKLYDDSTEEERIAAFRGKFPDYDTPYPNRDLFAFHHVLTGSCRMGREQFVSSHGISMDGATTVRQFVELTQDSYGGETVRKLPEAYGITE